MHYTAVLAACNKNNMANAWPLCPYHLGTQCSLLGLLVPDPPDRTTGSSRPRRPPSRGQPAWEFCAPKSRASRRPVVCSSGAALRCVAIQAARCIKPGVPDL